MKKAPKYIEAFQLLTNNPFELVTQFTIDCKNIKKILCTHSILNFNILIKNDTKYSI